MAYGTRILTLAALAAAAGCVRPASDTRDLVLAYFMGPAYPMNAALLTPFSERVAELSGGKLTVSHFPVPKTNVVSFLFPKTNVVSFPGVCLTAVECTEALERARPVLEREYQAKVLAIWASDAPVLLTRDRPVRALEDMRGLKIRVSSRGDIAFIEALGANAVMQPGTVLQQNLANGVLDGIAIALSGISALRLHEPANFLTTWLPLSGAPFVLLMLWPLPSPAAHARVPMSR